MIEPDTDIVRHLAEERRGYAAVQITGFTGSATASADHPFISDACSTCVIACSQEVWHDIGIKLYRYACRIGRPSVERLHI